MRYRGFGWGPGTRASLSLAVILAALTGFLTLTLANEVTMRLEGNSTPRWRAIVITVLLLGALAAGTRRSWHSWRKAGRAGSAASRSEEQSLEEGEPAPSPVAPAAMGMVVGGWLLIVAGFVAGAVARRHHPMDATHHHLASGLSHTGYDVLVIGAWAMIILGLLMAIMGLVRYWAIQTADRRDAA